MSYELNDDEVALMAEVHAHRVDPKSNASEYLCVNVDNTIASIYKIVGTGDDPVAHLQSVKLCRAIHDAMDGYMSLYIYLRRKVPGFTLRTPARQHELTNMAREAWLTRMIETRKIA